MFGKNKPEGLALFAKETRLLVTSVFTTLQGEGPFRGRACVFVRLAKCQLTCSFCDTYFDKGDWLTREELMDKIGFSVSEAGLLENGTESLGLVITGGEPSLQKEALVPFLNKLISTQQFAWIQIETNGLIVMKDLSPEVIVVVSPKCLEKQGKAIRYYPVPKESLGIADCLKFVIESNVESAYNKIPDWAFDWKNQTGRDVYVSPMNIYLSEPRLVKERKSDESLSLEHRSIVDEVVSFWEPNLLDMKSIEENHKYTAKYALDNNLVFQVQLHLFAALA